MGKPSTENRAVRSEQKPAARHGQKRGIKDRRAGDMPLAQGLSDLVEGSLDVEGDDVTRHHVLDGWHLRAV